MITRQKIGKWLDAKAKLNHYKKEEAKLRREIAQELLEGKGVGTHTFNKLGYIIKATKKYNYNLDKDALSAIWDDLTPAEKEAIEYAPKLSLTKYKMIDDPHMLNQVIITKEAMPTISIEEEKDE